MRSEAIHPDPSPIDPPARPVGLLELCVGFLLVGLLGFGGLAASGFYVIVERNKWLDRRDFVELFGICSVLPGGNVLNASIVLGDRYQGPLGAVLALSSLMLAPLAILMMLAVVYENFSHLPDVRAASAGAASAVAGMTIGAAGKMIHGLNRTWGALVFGAATFIAIAFLRIPLAAVVLVIAPMAVAFALYAARKEQIAARKVGDQSVDPADG